MSYICKSCMRRLRCAKTPKRRHISTSVAEAAAPRPPPPPPPPSKTTIPPTSSSPPRPNSISIPLAALSYYWDTFPPTKPQLSLASSFFTAKPPTHLWTASAFRTIASSSAPEVAFLGRSNVGKSSLLNALMNKKICYTSSKPGRTRAMSAFGVSGGRLVVLDMPGYGKGSREEWGKEILKYLVGRKQLRRAFLLINAMHGIKKTDEQLLGILRHHAIPHQIVVSKVDRIILPNTRPLSKEKLERRSLDLKTRLEGMRPIIQPSSDEGPGALGEIVCCSAEKPTSGAKLGIDALRWSVLSAAGLENLEPKTKNSLIRLHR